MPNHGPSGRCLTCKQRHVKCDEGRPACSPCRRLRLNCGGYSKQYAFKDESYKFAAAASHKTGNKERGASAAVQHSARAGEPGRSLLTGADVAVPFFLVHYAGMGRRLAAARGFYETLIPAYTSQGYDSPLSLAVSAVAARVFSLWRHEDAVEATYLAPYTQAVASLHSALRRPEDYGRPTTALTILALHLYESISAVYDARRPTPAHHYGALSLLPTTKLDGLDGGLIGTYVKGFVLHTEISSALRQKRSVHVDAYTCINGAGNFSLIPGNFSLTLDSIGAQVAQLQADYVRILPRRQVSGPSLMELCKEWITEAGRIEQLLLAWAQNTPGRWRPLRVTRGRDFDPSIPTYQLACDIYPSCQIATLWNLWRFHRLLLLKISVGAKRILTLSQDESVNNSNERLMPAVVECTATIQVGSGQELVDGICHSVPFYLGNRSGQCSLRDFADPGILFPSYHLLRLETNARLAEWQRHQDHRGNVDVNDTALSEDEHQRHMIAYGAWHILSPLSNLLTLFSDDHGGRLVAGCLRPGQQAWIRKQFLRVSALLRLCAARPCDGDEAADQSRSPMGLKSSLDSGVTSLTRQVREGTVFMSGP